MITLGADWLRSRWAQLSSEGRCLLPLSRWDGGDALTLVELGSLPSAEQITGEVVMVDNNSSSPAAVELIPLESQPEVASLNTFLAPDGRWYRVTGKRRDESGSELVVPVEIVDVENALSERRSALLETSLLSTATAAVIGLGTGGIHVALELAKAGVGRFALLDADRLGVGNVARHHAGISHAGRRKVYVGRDLILEKNPVAKVEVHAVAAGPGTEALVREVVEAADIIVCATDGRPSKLFINRIAVAASKTTVYGGAFRRAYGGQVLRVRPGRSPCYQCFVMAMPDEETDREVASAEDALEIAYSDRPVPIEPGLSLDVAPIALMVARLGLHELVAEHESTLNLLERDLAAPWYLWVNRPEPDTAYASWPPLSESSDDMTIFRWYGVHLEREAACPVCGDFTSAVRDGYGIDGQVAVELPEPPSGLTFPQEE